MKRWWNRFEEWAHSDLGDALLSGALLMMAMVLIIWLSWVVA